MFEWLFICASFPSAFETWTMVLTFYGWRSCFLFVCAENRHQDKRRKYLYISSSYLCEWHDGKRIRKSVHPGFGYVGFPCVPPKIRTTCLNHKPNQTKQQLKSSSASEIRTFAFLLLKAFHHYECRIESMENKCDMKKASRENPFRLQASGGTKPTRKKFRTLNRACWWMIWQCEVFVIRDACK